MTYEDYIIRAVVDALPRLRDNSRLTPAHRRFVAMVEGYVNARKQDGMIATQAGRPAVAKEVIA